MHVVRSWFAFKTSRQIQSYTVIGTLMFTRFSRTCPTKKFAIHNSRHFVDGDARNMKVYKAKECKQKARVVKYKPIRCIGVRSTIEPISKTHWVGGGSFADKDKTRPPNVLVLNLPGGGWCSGIEPNSYCGSMGSYLSNSNENVPCQQRDSYLGHSIDMCHDADT